MIEYENECCDCATEGYPCRGALCKRRRVAHFYCDACGAEEKLFYTDDGKQLCAECAGIEDEDDSELDVVEGSDNE